jgi:hypothetical protein
MPRFEQPKLYIPGLNRLLSLTDAELSEFVVSLESAQPCLSFNALAQQFSLSGQLSRAATKDILFLLERFLSYQQLEDLSVGDLLNSVLEELAANFDSTQRQTVRNRLEMLLKVDGALKIAAKARDLLTETQKLFLGCRVVTDIRPIYAIDEPPSAPKALALMHTLKIDYYENFQNQEFFLTLDDNDLKNLLETIERARLKVASLKPVIEQSGVPQLLVGED